MRLAKTILLAVLAVALAGYAFDCGAATTPEQAMQCCNSMHCTSSHGHHGQDCCKTMPRTHAAFLQPSTERGVTHSPGAFAVMPAPDEFQGSASSAGGIVPHC